MQRRGKDLRVGDSEREHAINQLGEHMSAGRLDITEYDQRCARVAAARFTSEIARVFDDLPTSSPPRPSPGPERSSRPNGVALLWLLGAGGLLLVVVTKQIWVLALLAVLAVVLWAGRHRGSR